MTNNIDYTKLIAGSREVLRRKMFIKELKTETNECVRERMLEELNKAPSEEYEYFIQYAKYNKALDYASK